MRIACRGRREQGLEKENAELHAQLERQRTQQGVNPPASQKARWGRTSVERVKKTSLAD